MHTYCSHFVTMATAFVTLFFHYKHFITYSVYNITLTRDGVIQ